MMFKLVADNTLNTVCLYISLNIFVWKLTVKKCIKHTGIVVTYLQMVLVLINFQGIEWYVHLSNSNTK
jgi:hypothetical protein